MRKPVNGFAVAVWVLAAVLAIGEFIFIFAFGHISLAFAQSFYGTIANLWAELRNPIFTIGQLIALGAIIELLDQIRGNAKPGNSN